MECFEPKTYLYIGRGQFMFYIVYETKNLVNGKLYRGAHKTSDLNDGYLGSGSALARAIEKYGIHSFTRRILESCSSVEEMYAMEEQLVDREWIARPDTYNLVVGGTGGWKRTNVKICKWCEKECDPPIHARHEKACDMNPVHRKQCPVCGTDIKKQNITGGYACRNTYLLAGKNNGRYIDGRTKEHAMKPKLPFGKGSKHTEETRRKISENSANKLSQEIIDQRISDFHEIEKKRGFKTKLAKKWGISHTQARRFMLEHKLI
jgi:hypothetical protein